MKHIRFNCLALLILLLVNFVLPFSLQARVPVSIPASPDVKSALGVRRFGMATVTNYSNWIGRRVKFTTAYMDWEVSNLNLLNTTFNHLTTDGSICSGLTDKEPLTAVISMPMVPHGLPTIKQGGSGATRSNFSRALTGEWDAQYRAIGARIAERKLGVPWPDGRPKLVLRLGWEQSGNWYPWSSIGAETEFKACWRHIVDVVEQAAGTSVVWEWNCSGSMGERTQVTKAYPGDDVVDVIGIDFYDGMYPNVSTFAKTTRTEAEVDKVWMTMLNGAGDGKATGDTGIQWLADFARAHGKKMNLSEWGLRVHVSSAGYSGGGDDPFFIQNVFCWYSNLASSGGLLCMNYFETGDMTGHDIHKLSPGPAKDLITVGPGVTTGSNYPHAAQKFISLFGGPLGQGSTTPAVILTNPAGGTTYYAPATVTLKANVTGSALQVDFYKGSDLIGTARQAPYQVTISKLPAGNYTLTARVTDQYGNVATSQPSNIKVVTNTRPVISLTSPVGGTSSAAPSDILIAAKASDTTGHVTKVEFYKGTTLIGTSTNSPYYMIWKNVPAGNYSFKAKATDDGNLTTTSASVNFSVKTVKGNAAAPNASITSPVNGATFNAPAKITINASATDADGVSQVAFYQGSTLLGTDTTAPYSFNWTNVPAGTYSLTVKAVDAKGSVRYSNLVKVTVNVQAVNVPPSISISTSASATLTAPASVKIDATATDGDGSISRVEFYNGVTLLGSDSTSPYSISLVGMAAGNYSFTAKAFDDEGAATTSNSIGISVVAPPLVAPTGLTLTVLSASEIKLAWNDQSSNETGFKIERKTGASGTYTQIKTTAANIKSFKNTGLAAHTQYFYRLRATNGDGNSEYSNEASATTLDVLPAAPDGLTVTIGSSKQLILSWADHASNETGFKIERKKGLAGTYAQIGTVGADIETYNDKTLTPNTRYYYRVLATNSYGDSDYSNEATERTPAIAVAPGITSPETFTASVNTPVSYQITASGTPLSYAAVGLPAELSLDPATGWITGTLSTAGTYPVTVSASGAGGTGSLVVSFVIEKASLAAPTHLTGEIAGSTVSLSWSDNASDETSYRIHRKEGTNGQWSYFAKAGADATSLSDTTVQTGKTYFYRVRVRKGETATGIEFSGWSNTVSVTVP